MFRLKVWAELASIVNRSPVTAQPSVSVCVGPRIVFLTVVVPPTVPVIVHLEVSAKGTGAAHFNCTLIPAVTSTLTNGFIRLSQGTWNMSTHFGQLY